MSDRRADIIRELESALTESIDLFTSLPPDRLAVTVYRDDPGWTVKQVLAHFITIEKTMHWLFRDILSGGPGSPEDFDVDRFNRTQPAKLDGLAIEALAAQFRAVRQETIAIVREMSEEDLDREGRHAFHGHGKLERFVRWAYEHARLHENDVRQALAAG
jgi:hypothetical protein